MGISNCFTAIGPFLFDVRYAHFTECLVFASGLLEALNENYETSRNKRLVLKLSSSRRGKQTNPLIECHCWHLQWTK